MSRAPHPHEGPFTIDVKYHFDKRDGITSTNGNQTVRKSGHFQRNAIRQMFMTLQRLPKSTEGKPKYSLMSMEIPTEIW